MGLRRKLGKKSRWLLISRLTMERIAHQVLEFEDSMCPHMEISGELWQCRDLQAQCNCSDRITESQNMLDSVNHLADYFLTCANCTGLSSASFPCDLDAHNPDNFLKLC